MLQQYFRGMGGSALEMKVWEIVQGLKKEIVQRIVVEVSFNYI